MKKQSNCSKQDMSEIIRNVSERLNHRPTSEEIRARYDEEVAEMQQNFEWARDAMLRVAMKNVGHDLGALRILKAMFSTPSKEDREANIARMEYLCEVVGREYDPNRPITIGELRKAKPELVEELLETISGVKPEVRQDASDGKTKYCWPLTYSGYPVIGNLCFAVQDETFLTCSESGIIDDLTEPYPCPYLVDEIGLDLPAHDYKMLPGIYSQTVQEDEILQYFEPTTLMAATHLLLVAKWGGPHSDTRGAKDIFQLNRTGIKIAVLDKLSSKKGGQGYDLVIMPLDQGDYSLNECVAGYETAHVVKQARAAETFQRKLELVEQIEQQQEAAEKALDETRKRIIEAEKACALAMGTQYPWVTCPEYDLNVPKLCGTCPGEFQESTLDMDLDKLKTMAKDLSTANISGKLQRYVRKVEAEAASWREFAPQYALLDHAVRSSIVHGDMEINADHVLITLPSQDGTDERLVLKYYFSEAQLAKARNDLAKYADLEQECFERNQKILDLIRKGLVAEPDALKDRGDDA